MRAALGRARPSVLAFVLVAACGGRTEAPPPSYPFDFPESAQEFCDELFNEHDGCGRRDMETCLSVWQTDGSCDAEEETLLDCILHGDGYQCRDGVQLHVQGTCQTLALETVDCQDGE